MKKTRLTDVQRSFLEVGAPYECKQCGRGTQTNYICPFCDDGVLRFAWRRGGIQTFVPAAIFLGLWLHTGVELFIAPFGLFVLWNLYLLTTSRRRMKKNFRIRNPRRN